MSSMERGLFLPLRFWASQSLGTGELPADAINHVGIGIVLDGVNERGKGQILAEFLAAIGIEDEFAGQFRVVGCRDVEDGRVDGEEVAVGCHLVEDAIVEAWAGRVLGVAAGHAESDGLVARNLVQQRGAVVYVFTGHREALLVQQRAGMVHSVDVEAAPFLEELLEHGMGWIGLIREDGYRCAPVDLFQAVQDRPEVGLVLHRVAHVVDGQYHHGLHARLAHPHRGGELRKGPVNIVRVRFVQVSQSVTVRCRNRA